MNNDLKIFNDIYKKMLIGSVLKSFLISSIFIFCIDLIVITYSYFKYFNKLYILVPINIALFILLTVLLYFIFFRTKKSKVAKKLDSYALDERISTMLELKEDPSFMASQQRKDALSYLSNLNSKYKKVNLPLKIFMPALILFLASTIYFSVVVSQMDARIVITKEQNKVEKFQLVYIPLDGGEVVGDMYQEVNKNNDANEIKAVANEGYVFVGWSDGLKTKVRRDTKIKESKNILAIFLDEKYLFIEPNKKDKYSKEGFNINMEFDSDKKNMHADGAAGLYEEYNNVLDGETYYRDVYEKYYKENINQLNNGKHLPDDIRIMIENYYKSIE